MPKRPDFSDEERVLLEAIHDQPREEGRYLAYAAWLEAAGHPMAEFLRLRCAIERGRGTEPAASVVALEGRAEQLLAAHGREWGRPVSREFEFWTYSPHGMPWVMDRSLSHAEEEFLERADGWLKRMSPRLFVALNDRACQYAMGVLAFLPLPFIGRDRRYRP